MSIRPHRWVDDQIIYLTDEEIAAAKADDAAYTEWKATQALLPKPLTDAERVTALEVDNELLKARLDALETK